MSEIEADLTSVAGIVSSVAGGLTSVGAVATTLGKIADLFEPVVTQDEIQSYETAFKNRNTEITNVMSQPDSMSRANAMRNLFDGLCSQAGTPTGCFGENVSVPISYLVAFLTIASGKIRDDQYLAGFQQATVKPSKS